MQSFVVAVFTVFTALGLLGVDVPLTLIQSDRPYIHRIIGSVQTTASLYSLVKFTNHLSAPPPDDDVFEPEPPRWPYSLRQKPLIVKLAKQSSSGTTFASEYTSDTTPPAPPPTPETQPWTSTETAKLYKLTEVGDYPEWILETMLIMLEEDVRRNPNVYTSVAFSMLVQLLLLQSFKRKPKARAGSKSGQNSDSEDSTRDQKELERSRTASQSAQILELSAQLEQLRTEMTNQRAAASNAKGETERLSSTLQSLQEKMNDSPLGDRVAVVEQSILKEQKESAAKKDLNMLSSHVEDVQTQMAKLLASIGKLESQLEGVTNKVENSTTEVSLLSERLNSIQLTADQIPHLQSKVSACQHDLGNLDERLQQVNKNGLSVTTQDHTSSTERGDTSSQTAIIRTIQDDVDALKRVANSILESNTTFYTQIKDLEQSNGAISPEQVQKDIERLKKRMANSETLLGKLETAKQQPPSRSFSALVNEVQRVKLDTLINSLDGQVKESETRLAGLEKRADLQEKTTKDLLDKAGDLKIDKTRARSDGADRADLEKLNRTISGLKTDINTLKTTAKDTRGALDAIDNMQTDIGALKITTMHTEHALGNADLAGLKEEVNTLGVNLNSIQTDVDKIKARKATKDPEVSHSLLDLGRKIKQQKDELTEVRNSVNVLRGSVKDITENSTNESHKPEHQGDPTDSVIRSQLSGLKIDVDELNGFAKRTRSRLEDLEARSRNFETTTTALKSNLKELETKADDASFRELEIEKLETKTAEVDKTAQSLVSSVKALEAKDSKASRELQGLAKRTDMVEKTTQSLESTVKTLKTKERDSFLDEFRVGKLEKRTAEIETTTEELKTSVGELKAREDNTSATEVTKLDIERLESKAKGLEKATQDLETNMKLLHERDDRASESVVAQELERSAARLAHVDDMAQVTKQDVVNLSVDLRELKERTEKLGATGSSIDLAKEKTIRDIKDHLREVENDGMKTSLNLESLNVKVRNVDDVTRGTQQVMRTLNSELTICKERLNIETRTENGRVVAVPLGTLQEERRKQEEENRKNPRGPVKIHLNDPLPPANARDDDDNPSTPAGKTPSSAKSPMTPSVPDIPVKASQVSRWDPEYKGSNKPKAAASDDASPASTNKESEKRGGRPDKGKGRGGRR
ncbi:hypothetical protein AJ80_05364 [Polytolypa hystricis UAMH7299]|uniref:Uncharacterized protein n=1 Tax=Polytolypa hystricis (strain UAMH7299) TaxID=1447883 RepID=A0A2B7Y521_POLH7|nr:hypothetical protein AJ80_05364 [Polytolypa hystricis UAMH7299]